MKIIIKDLIAAFEPKESSFNLLFRLYQDYKVNPSDALREKIKSCFQFMTGKEKGMVIWNMREEAEYGLEKLIENDEFFEKYYSSDNSNMKVLKITKQVRENN